MADGWSANSNGVMLVSQLELYLMLIAPCYHNFMFIIDYV